MTAALALIQDNRAAAGFVSRALQDAFSRFKGTTKLVAAAANANERSAENWLQQRVCPNVPAFLRLAMQVPELGQAVTWLLQHGPNHPEAARMIGNMERYIEERGPQ